MRSLVREAAAILVLLAVAPAQAVERDMFLRFFDATVFGGDTAGVPLRDTVLKATGDMQLDLVGPQAADWLGFLQGHAAALSELTGLGVTAAVADTVPAMAPGHIAIHFVPHGGFDDVVAQPWIPPGWRDGLTRSLCFFVTFGRGTIRGGMVVIEANLPEATKRHCLLEETTQAFGVVNDSTLLGGSVFNDRGPLQSTMTDVDRLVVRILYDRRLSAGMPRAAAMALVPDIYDELAGGEVGDAAGQGK